MRWKEKEPKSNIRSVRRFLFLPTTLDGETRWLEWALIKQELHGSVFGEGWDDVKWVD